jgi:hypothetical protein
MHRKSVVFGMAALVAGAAGFAACDRGPQALSAPAVAVQGQGGFSQDLEGLPDLVVHTPTISSSWVVREETFVDGQCSVEEGNIPTGTHRSLRFSVLINNAGDADLYVGDPLAHMDPNGDGSFADADGLFEFASCHAHFHFRNYATYELLRVNADGSFGAPVQSRKRGFCMLDTTPAQVAAGQAPRTPYYRNCGNLTIHGNQGISKNWGDEYSKQLPGQLFLLTDPNEPVAPGKYVIKIVANPAFAQTAGQPCPAKDPQGMCRNFAESDYSNNIGMVQIEIPDHVGRFGYGPGKGEFQESLDANHHPEAHGQSQS